MKKIVIIVLAALILIEGGILAKDYMPWINSKVASYGQVNLQKLAEDVVDKCGKEKHRPSCYDRQIPMLMDPPHNVSLEDAFKLTSIVQKMDTTYTYCHVLGHEISAKEVRKDPSNWKKVLSRCPSGVCSNGCIHGGFQEKFRSETLTDAQIDKLKPELATICEARPDWNPTGLEQGSCYHALGHMGMYMTDADISKSVILCGELAKKENGRDFTQVCLDGAFMQIYQPLEPEDFELIAGKEVKKDDVIPFCNKFEGNARGSCISESWPLFRSQVLTPDGLVDFCNMEEESQKDRCYLGMFFVVAAQFNLNTDNITTFCSGLPSSRVGQCFANSAARIIEVDWGNIEKAVNLCKASVAFDKEERCYKELTFYSTFNFHKGSTEFYKICNLLPEPHKSACLGGPRQTY